MDEEVAYPEAKRCRTSLSRSPTRSRSPRDTPRDSEHDRRSRSASKSPTRSSPQRRYSRSESSHYDAPRRSGSRKASQYSSRSISPIPRSQRSLKYKPLTTLPRAHARGITRARFSPDGALLATASADATINIYTVPSTTSPESATSFKHIRTLRGHLAGVNALAWSPTTTSSNKNNKAHKTTTTTTTTATTSTPYSNYVLASASDDKDIMLWSPLSSDAPIAPSPLTGHSNYVYSLAFSPKGNMLVSGSYDEAVFLWDVRSGRCMRQLPAHSDPVGGVDFAGDGTMMCSCSTDGLIRIWDSGTGQCLRTLVDEDRKGVTSVMFSPNARFVLAWTLDGCVRLWNYAEGRCVKTYQGHVNKEFSLGGTVGSYVCGDGSEGAFLASGSEDGDVVVWDVSSKELLWRGEGHRDVVLSVDYVKAGERGLLVSVGKDRDVRVWVEDVDEKLLRRRRERVADQEEQAARAEEQMAAGYEVEDEEEEDADTHMGEIETDEGQHGGGANEVAMDVGGAADERNGHATAIEVDGAVA